jgi:HEAT repeat protein
VKTLLSSDDAFLRKTCFILANQVGTTKEFFELAKRDIGDSHLELSLSAIRVLSKSDPEKALPILRSLLDDPIWQVREVALTHLAPLCDKESFEKIGSMLHDPVWWVRYRAGMALLNYKETGKELLNKISNSDSDNYAAVEAKYILLRHGLQEEL